MILITMTIPILYVNGCIICRLYESPFHAHHFCESMPCSQRTALSDAAVTALSAEAEADIRRPLRLSCKRPGGMSDYL